MRFLLFVFGIFVAMTEVAVRARPELSVVRDLWRRHGRQLELRLRQLRSVHGDFKRNGWFL